MEMVEMVSKDREYRAFEMRTASDEMTVEGYAAMFNAETVLYSIDGVDYKEEIAPEAFRNAQMSDVVMNYNHTGKPVARTKNGTLSLEVDSVGLKVRANLGGTEEGRKIHQEIEGGYLTKMSYRFVVEDDEVKEFSEGDKRVILRTITNIRKLYDVSVVSIPADDHTSISARSFSDGLIEKLQAERLEAEKKEEEKRQAVLEAEARNRELDLIANS
jgi:HK97 family phage prohead protease